MDCLVMRRSRPTEQADRILSRLEIGQQRILLKGMRKLIPFHGRRSAVSRFPVQRRVRAAACINARLTFRERFMGDRGWGRKVRRTRPGSS